MTIADLRALEAQATPRPWQTIKQSDTKDFYLRGLAPAYDYVAGDDEWGGGLSEADAVFLTALRNSESELLAVAEAAQAAREVMKDRSERDEQGRVVIRPQRWEEAWQVFDAALAALDARLRETP